MRNLLITATALMTVALTSCSASPQSATSPRSSSPCTKYHESTSLIISQWRSGDGLDFQGIPKALDGLLGSDFRIEEGLGDVAGLAAVGLAMETEWAKQCLPEDIKQGIERAAIG